MKILKIVDNAAWDINSYQALHLSIQLAKKGHTVVVMCPKDSRLADECLKYKVPVKPFTLVAKFGFFELQDYDIIHLYNTYGIGQLTIKKAAAHGRIVYSQLRLDSMAAMMKLKGIEPLTVKFLASCPTVREDMLTAGLPASRVAVLPPCINTSLGRWESAMLIKRTMAVKKEFQIGTVSMDKTLLDQELFLRIARAVLDRDPSLSFTLVGLKDERIRKLARNLEISHKLDMLGERTDMPEVMAMLNIYVKATMKEEISMSLMEAQASGVTCVIPRLRGLSDYTVHETTGLVVPPGDTESYAAAILRLADDRGSAESLAKAAYESVDHNMSVEVVANLLEAHYEDALSSGQPAQNQVQ
ncbi:MAG: glycosyltransferase family 4 protein [Elusimicrobiota bacterium]|jgi:glycosyltransferase involved in cell wall biosynthesis